MREFYKVLCHQLESDALVPLYHTDVRWFASGFVFV